MAYVTINASPDFLNQLDWQLRRLMIFIVSLEGLVVSLRDLHEVLETLAGEAQLNR